MYQESRGENQDKVGGRRFGTIKLRDLRISLRGEGQMEKSDFGRLNSEMVKL
jgi:hypothetical protein